MFERSQYLRLCIALLAIGSLGQAAPRARGGAPAWQLDIAFGDPQRIALRLPGESKDTTFWYVLFKVTNDTGADRRFFPSIRLVTNTLEVVEGGSGISPRVYDAIIARHRQEWPFLAPPFKITGLLLQGEANARTSVAVFRDFDDKASAFSVLFSGFSGKIDRVANPAFDPDKSESKTNPREFLLRKTLKIEYDLPGDAVTRSSATPIRRTREWIMR